MVEPPGPDPLHKQILVFYGGQAGVQREGVDPEAVACSKTARGGREAYRNDTVWRLHRRVKEDGEAALLRDGRPATRRAKRTSPFPSV